VEPTARAAAPAVPPGPPPRAPGLVPSLRYAASFLVDPLGFVGGRFARHGDVYYAPSGGVGLYVVRRAEHAREVLVEQADAYAKTHTALTSLAGVLGSGLLTSDGEVWRRHRRLANPAFARKAVQGYVAPMIASAVEASGALRDGQRVDLAERMTDLTLRVVGRTLFGTDVAADVATIARSMRTFQTLLAAPKALPRPLARLVDARVRRARRDLDDLSTRLLAARRLRRADPPDLVQLLVDAVDPDDAGARLDEAEVRDEIVTFLLAGHDTTANTLAWAFWLLAMHPDVEADVRRELREVLGGRTPAPADLERLVVTEAVIKETLRLYPAAPMIPRRAVREATVGGYVVPAGSEVIVWVYFTHRDARAFPDPEAFRPARFLGGGESALPKGAFIPFGAGPRACIGRTFAMAEAVAALAVLLQRWTFEYVGGRPPRPRPRITLAPGGGVPVRVRRAP
jgi:cytochrome P450